MSIIKEIKADKLLIKVYDSRNSLGIEAAKEVGSKIREMLSAKDEVNIVFASAPSQNEFLSALINENIEWNKINAFHMDEYIGLDKEAPQGFGNFIKARLFSKINCKSVNYMDGNAKDISAECERYSRLLKEYPVDIVCCGIGENGHLAFNDPPVADFNDKKLVKVVELEDECRQQQVNDGCFKSIEMVPKTAMTMTIPALFAAGSIYGMVPGTTKMEAVYHTAVDDIGIQCPATILKKHGNAVLFTDIESAQLLLK